jgi:hypothetical protein
MNIALIAGILGAFLLVFKEGVWIGVAVMAISVVLFFLDSSSQKRFAGPPQRLQYAFPNPQQYQPNQEGKPPTTGVSWNTSDTLGNPMGKRQGPYMDGNDFNLPLPMGDLTNLVDMRHKTKIR